MLHHTPSRKQPRVPIDVEVSALDGEHLCAARARDLSMGGLYVDTDQSSVLNHVNQVSLIFTLPGQDEPVWALCDIVRDDRRRQVDGHALRFARMAESDRQRVDAYVTDYFAPVARPRPLSFATSAMRTAGPDLFRFRSASELLC